MILKEINLTNFRNYDSLKIKLNPNINIICGKNAQGKTNLLESIYFLGLTKSYKQSNSNNLIKYGRKKSKVKGTIENNKIKNNLEIFLNDNQKIIKKNNIEIKKIEEYLNNSINIIIFSPKDLELLYDSPIIRREYINTELSQLSNNYNKILNEYNKLLKIRNDLLKKFSINKKINMCYFDVITKHLISKATIICKMRNKFINELNDSTDIIFKKIFNEDGFNIKYETNFIYDIEYYENKMLEIYKNNFDKEVNFGATQFGPHRDEIYFYLKNENLKEYGSQGQQRLAILCMKLSEIELFKKYKNTNPILLLDDVFSELDSEKRKRLIEYLKNDVQVIITTTDLKYINKKIYEDAYIFNIKNGTIINLKEVEKNGKE